MGSLAEEANLAGKVSHHVQLTSECSKTGQLSSGPLVDSGNRAYKYETTQPHLSSMALPMCNDYRLKVDIGTIIEEFADLKIRIRFNEGVPNLEPRDDIKITDTGPIVRGAEDTEETELVQRRWSWPGPSKRPVYNFRSEGRDFASNRCLIPADGFYEFTDPKDPSKKRKDKWLFTMPGRSVFCVAGIWRSHPEVGEAFTMLTTAPGPDVAPYHDRQIVILERDAWAGWLNPNVPAQSLIRPLAAGALAVEQVG